MQADSALGHEAGAGLGVELTSRRQALVRLDGSHDLAPIVSLGSPLHHPVAKELDQEGSKEEEGERVESHVGIR